MSADANKLTLNIDEDIFSDVYWKINDVDTRFLVLFGGGSSGKSISVAQRSIIKGLRKKKRILYIRKVEKTIKESTFNDIKKWLNEFNLKPYYRATVSPPNIYLANGTEFLFRGLDDPEKIKSISDIDEIVVEEASELSQDDFFELNRRLRGKDEMQITLMFNPIDEDHWIKQHFIDKNVPNTTIVHVTYKDNKFCTEEDIQQLLDMQLYNENQYNIYALGKWGRLKTGSEFFPNFSTVRHVGEVKYLPHLGIHQSWDFNWLPYQPMCCFQIAENVKRWEKKVFIKNINGEDIPTIQRFKIPTDGCREIFVTQIRAFKEYAFRPPVNDVENVCKKFIENYGQTVTDLFYYGDASGKSNIPGQGDGSNFKRIRKTQERYLNKASDRVLRSNPSVGKSRDFMNRVFANGYPIEFIIDKENCPLLIKDLESVLLTRDGMLKKMVKDKNTGVVHQENGHFADLTRYLMIRVFYDLFKANI